MKHILQHYTQEEQHFVKTCLALKQSVLQNGQLKTTNFLTLREQEILKSIIGKSANLIFDAGIENGERKIAIISEYNIASNSKHTEILEIKYNKKFGVLKHGDVLGAILGLGLERKVIGDIIFSDVSIYVVVQNRIAGYLLQELHKIGKQNVTITLTTDVVLKKEVEVLQQKTIYLKSVRIDSLLAHTLPCNREYAKKIIQKELVQKNWVVTKNISDVFEVQDVLSVRRFGRIYIDDIIKTKKDRFKIEVRTT